MAVNCYSTKSFPFFIFTFLLCSGSIALSTSNSNQSAYIDFEVTDSLNRDEEISVIIILNDGLSSFDKSGKTKEENFENFQKNAKKNDELQSKILLNLSPSDFKVKHKYSIVNGFSGRISLASLM